jgi:hypothetical protein
MPSPGIWRCVDLFVNLRFGGTYRLHLHLLSNDYPCGLLSLPPCSYMAVCFRLVAPSAATCSRWFLTRGFFYSEDGGDTFLRNVGSHKMYTAPHPRRRHSSLLLKFFPTIFRRPLLAKRFTFFSLPYYSTLKMEVTCSSETLIEF